MTRNSNQLISVVSLFQWPFNPLSFKLLWAVELLCKFSREMQMTWIFSYLLTIFIHYLTGNYLTHPELQITLQENGVSFEFTEEVQIHMPILSLMLVLYFSFLLQIFSPRFLLWPFKCEKSKLEVVWKRYYIL